MVAFEASSPSTARAIWVARPMVRTATDKAGICRLGWRSSRFAAVRCHVPTLAGCCRSRRAWIPARQRATKPAGRCLTFGVLLLDAYTRRAGIAAAFTR